MIYFKKIPFQPNLNKQQMESAFRKTAVRQRHSLDLVRSSTDVGTKMLFLGYQSKKELTFTRIRTSFEALLPKLIINLPADPAADYYKVRFSFVTTLAFGLIAFAFIIGLSSLLTGRTEAADFAVILILLLVFYLLLLLEFKITYSRIAKAIKNTQATN